MENRMWICEGIGYDECVSKPMDMSSAKAELREKIKAFHEDMESLNGSIVDTPTEFEFFSSDGDLYQAYWTYPVPETDKEKLMLELDRAYYGLQAYTYYLEDSGLCANHLGELRKLIESLPD